MKPFDQLFQHVLPFALGCPEPVAEFNLLLAAQDFCSRTRCWRMTLDPVTAEPGFGPYDIELEQHSELVRIERASVDGRKVDVIPVDEMPFDWMERQNTAREGIVTMDNKTFYVLSSSDVDRTVSMDVTLRPSDTATGLTDEIASLYARHIAAGALEMILLIQDQPFTSAAMSDRFAAKFKAGIAKTSIKVQRGSSASRSRRQICTY